MKIVNKFDYTVLYNNEIYGSFNDAYYCSNYNSLKDAIKMIKSAWENNEFQDGKYFIAMIKDDIYYPIMYAIRNRVNNTIELFPY